MSDWVEIAKTFGVPVALLAFFVWRDWMASRDQKGREETLGLRLDKIVDNHNRVTETVIFNNTKALEGVKDSNRELKDEIRNACKFRVG